jgi:hypothetical protein
LRAKNSTPRSPHHFRRIEDPIADVACLDLTLSLCKDFGTFTLQFP